MSIYGRKRHIVVDALGRLLTVVVHSVDQQDHEVACIGLDTLGEQLKQIWKIVADSADNLLGIP